MCEKLYENGTGNPAKVWNGTSKERIKEESMFWCMLSDMDKFPSY